MDLLVPGGLSSAVALSPMRRTYAKLTPKLSELHDQDPDGSLLPIKWAPSGLVDLSLAIHSQKPCVSTLTSSLPPLSLLC
jgi:hypothetical protein